MNSPIPTCLYLAHVAMLEDPTNPRYKSAAGVSVRADVAWLLVSQGRVSPCLRCSHSAGTSPLRFLQSVETVRMKSQRLL